MGSTRSPVLQRLDQLDTSSPTFEHQLCHVLYGGDYIQCTITLEGDDLIWLVDFLDKTLIGLNPACNASRKCLRELRTICSTKGILPTSYTLSSQLLDMDPVPLAGGGYGEVFKGTLNGSDVGIKRLRVYLKDDPKKAMKAFCQEAVMWKRLNHPNIMRLLGVTTSPRLQLISDWMPGGDLTEYLKGHPRVDILGLLLEIIGGLHYLHLCNIIHGDLKGANILVDNSGHARIADFGLAVVNKNIDSEPSASCYGGHTPRWSAPEVLKGGPCSKAADIFSFAMLMIEVFTGGVPFKEYSSFMAMSAIANRERPLRPRHPALTDKLWTLMRRCWAHDPKSRPQASETLRAFLDLDIPAWKKLINQALGTDEDIRIITAIFSDSAQAKILTDLSRDDTQAFVDKIDKVLDRLPPLVRGRCLCYMYRSCSHHALLPILLQIPLCYNPREPPVSRSGFTDMWKGQYRGKEVAAYVWRVYTTHDFTKISDIFCKEVIIWRSLNHPNVMPLLGVTMIGYQLVMVSEWAENGNVNEFVVANPSVNRFRLLADVVRGLIYMHDQGMVHGYLKGSNITVDRDGRARLIGFGIPARITDLIDFTAPSSDLGGTLRWMSPELLNPQRFGCKDMQFTRRSDCYALGMVILEVLSGEVPFARYRDFVVMLKVVEGEFPEKPEGVWFTNDIWRMLERCWSLRAGNRPAIKAVLQTLQLASKARQPRLFTQQKILEPTIPRLVNPIM